MSAVLCTVAASAVSIQCEIEEVAVGEGQCMSTLSKVLNSVDFLIWVVLFWCIRMWTASALL